FSPFSTKDDLLRAGINTAISISLTSCGGMIGVLNIGSEREVSEIHVSRDALASMGMIIGLAVERAQYNSAVQEVEETYKNLFVNAVHGLYRSAPDGRVIMVNPTLVKMLGYEREEELMQLNAERDIFVNPEDRKRFVDEMLSKGRVQHFETLNRRKDGSVIAVSDSAIAVRDKKNNLLYFQGIIEDISEKKALETKLRESEGLYRGLVEHSLVAVFLVQDERFRYVNQQMCQIFGYAQEELLIAEDPLSLVYPPDRDVVAGYFARVRKGEIDSFRHKFNAVRKDGKVIVVEILGARTEYQGMPAVIATGIDKTEEIRLQEQLLHSQKMESIGTLA
ncbi:MAG: PAS domain S-box protein, partial [Deltaproteobacteria bacterium]|nr:PAS domain S-box protein [Deltaproteobacteria bacterium]